MREFIACSAARRRRAADGVAAQPTRRRHLPVAGAPGQRCRAAGKGRLGGLSFVPPALCAAQRRSTLRHLARAKRELFKTRKIKC